jgi:hypothetical protein
MGAAVAQALELRPLRRVIADEGKRPKTLSKEWFSSNTKTTRLILARAWATLAGVTS